MHSLHLALSGLVLGVNDGPTRENPSTALEMAPPPVSKDAPQGPMGSSCKATNREGARLDAKSSTPP
eukprot:6967892-Alexandrium_andersonii.AAC.1